MRLRRLQDLGYTVFGWAQGFFAVGLIFVGAMQRADTTKGRARFPELSSVFALVDWMQSNGWWLIAVSTLCAGVLGWFRKKLGAPWLWDAVKFHLDEIRQIAFKVDPGDSRHHHRVTLFKHVRWKSCCRRWPWSGWLIAVERSGHTTRSGVPKFKAPDSADDVEGIAGKTWANLQIVRVSNLPDLSNSPSAEDRDVYAKSTFMTGVGAQVRSNTARSLTGIPVEVRGKPWGVIVLDSRRPDAIMQDNDETYRLASRLLGKLLERL